MPRNDPRSAAFDAANQIKRFQEDPKKMNLTNQTIRRTASRLGLIGGRCWMMIGAGGDELGNHDPSSFRGTSRINKIIGEEQLCWYN